MDDDQPLGRPLAEDESLKPGAFLRRPPDAPVYYGFPILDETEVGGFRYGAITDFESEPDDAGDGFVVAPDGTRAGLVWTVTGVASVDTTPVVAPDAERWGVWNVTFPFPMGSRDDAGRNLSAILPSLRSLWQQWRRP